MISVPVKSWLILNKMTQMCGILVIIFFFNFNNLNKSKIFLADLMQEISRKILNNAL